MNIGLMLYPDCVVSGLLAFAEMMNVANFRSGANHFKTRWVSNKTQPLNVMHGGEQSVFQITPEHRLDDAEIDVLLVPGFWTHSQQDVQQKLDAYEEEVTALKTLTANVHIHAYCTGCMLAAKAGVYNHREAAVTWWLADFARECFPKVQWNIHQSYLADKLGASASGLNGYLPIAQSLISHANGQSVLRDISDFMLLPKPQMTQKPFLKIKLLDFKNPFVLDICRWVESTPASELGLKPLANLMNMSARTLSRKVQQATGVSCGYFMRLIKLHQANEELIYSLQSVDEISHRLGYSDSTVFRRAFKQETQLSPGEYRRLYQR